ncbi:MAG: nucleoside transporter C-terminal domain-containing protein [Pirellulales bacterium]
MNAAEASESLPNPAERVPTSEPIAPTPLALRLAILATVAVIAGLVTVAHESLGRHVRAVLGIGCFIAVIAACSSNLRAVRWRTIVWGIGLQLGFALFIIKTAAGASIFQSIAQVVQKFLGFTNVGSEFVFGKLSDPAVLEKALGPNNGFVFAFTALPTIIFVSSFFTVLYYFGILQFVVRVMARAMMYMMGTSGAESLSAVANVFMGQTEAPLIVKPYVPRMTRSELLAMMVGGMATISGGVMAVYIAMGADPVAILATSVMAAPCGLYLSKLMLPETDTPETHGRANIKSEKLHSNAVDAAAGGASDGLYLALNVAAMIIAFLAFITLINYLLGLPYAWGWTERSMSLTSIFSALFYPVALLMGCEAGDAAMIADLLGTKLVTNEFVAYAKLTSPEAAGGYAGVISRSGLVLATYALTGFANISSIGIQLGGIGSMAPTRRADLAALGGRALLCGFLATLINASLAGMFLG